MNDEKEKNIKKVSKKPKSAIFNKLREFNLSSICAPLNKEIELDKNIIDENKDDNNEKENQNKNIKHEYFLNNNIFDQKNNNGNKYHLNYNNKTGDLGDDHDNIKLNPDEKLKNINEIEKKDEVTEDITYNEKEKSIKRIIKKEIQSKYIKTRKHQHHEKKEINEQIDISDFIPQIKDKYLIEKEIEKIKNEEKTKYINTEYYTENLLEKIEKEYYRKKDEVNDIKKENINININKILNEKLKTKAKEEKSKENNNKEKDYFKTLNLNIINSNFNSNNLNKFNNKCDGENNENKNCKKSKKNYNKKIGKFNLFLNKAFSNKFLFKDETNLYNCNSNSNKNININIDKIKKIISRNNQKSKNNNYIPIKSFSNRHLATTVQALSENKKKKVLKKNKSHNNNKIIKNLDSNPSIRDMINFMSNKKRINDEQNDKKEDLFNLPYSPYSTLWSNKFLNINYNSGIHYTDMKHGVPQLKIKRLKKKNLPPLYLTNNKFKSNKNKIFKTYSSNHKTYNLNMEINRINDYKNKNNEKENEFKSYKNSNEIEFTNINEINAFNQKYMTLIYDY